MKLIREYRAFTDPGGVFVEYRNVGDDGTSGKWVTILGSKGQAKNFRSTNAAYNYIREKVDAGDGVWENGAAKYFASQVKWTDEDLNRLDFAKWLIEHGKLGEEVTA